MHSTTRLAAVAAACLGLGLASAAGAAGEPGVATWTIEDPPREGPMAQAPEGERPRPERPAPPPVDMPGAVHDPTGLVPLTELGTQQYKGQDGGLYGEGRNEPPEAHAAMARKAVEQIRPRDAEGKPAADGKVVLVAIGMSNTTMEFRTFKAMADASPQKAPHVVIVDTAQGGRTAGAWANSLSGTPLRSAVPRAGEEYKGQPGENQPDQEKYGANHSVWDEADRRVKMAGCTPQQVQAVWIKVAGSVKLAYPEHLKEYQGHLAKIVCLAKQRWPNLQVAYLSSRIYAGYATSVLNPEPWSYESAFGVRGVIQEQIKGEPSLNADPSRGPVKAPVLLWGPYLWADGTRPRKSDGLVWERKDLAIDGTHPTSTGTRKVSEHLLRFLTTDPLARPWFAKAAEKK